MNACPTCGQSYHNPSARFCRHCGKSFIAAGDKPKPMVAAPATYTAAASPPLAAQAPTTTATQKLSTATHPRFAALPVGELIGTANQRYEILEILEESPDQLNLYRVKEHRQRLCEHCHSVTLIDSKFCAQCGQKLTTEAVQTFRVQEARQEALVARKLDLINQGLRHSGLVNLYSHFVDQPFDQQPRYYVVMEDLPVAWQERTLARLGGTHSLAQVLQWGRQIADVLTYLHSKQTRLPRLEAEQILLLDNEQVKLCKVETVVPTLAQDQKRVAAEAVRELALLLQRYLQGQAVPAASAAALSTATTPDQTLFATPQQLIEVLWARQLVGHSTITLVVGRLSDVGQQRQINEDSMLTLEPARVLNATSRAMGLYVVADGMGGHEGGEVASNLATKTLADTLWPKLMAVVQQKGSGFLPDGTEPDYKSLLTEACQAAAKAVYDQARLARKNMGTTLVAALVVGNRLYAANVGDSRLYKLNRTAIKRITEDHSMVERLVKHQMLSPEEARHHPQANLIYRSLGDRPKVEVDIFQEDLQVGDTLLLCSDGLSGQVAEAQMHALVLANPPQEACQQLVHAANAAGGPDNITVILVRVEAMDGSGA